MSAEEPTTETSPQAVPEEAAAATPAPKAAIAGRWEAFKSWANDQAYNAFTNTGYVIFKTVFRADVRGMDRLRQEDLKDKPAIIVANHLAHADPLFIASMLPRMKKKPAFIMHKGVYQAVMGHPVGRAVLNLSDILPLDVNNPIAVKTMAGKVEKGQPVVIFPEGQRTKTGTIEKVFNAAALVAQKTGVPIVPLHLDGLQYMKTGTEQLPHFPKRWFPKIRMNVFEPREIKVPGDLAGKGKKQKEELRRAMQRDMDQMMLELPVNAVDGNKTLMDSLHEAALIHGRRTFIVSEVAPVEKGVEERNLSYDELLKKSYGLGDRIAARTKEGENVGYLLPSSLAGVTAFWAMQAYNRVPALFNTTASQSQMESYVQTASLKTIVTSRTFVEKAKIQDRVDALSKICKIVYLEDLKQEAEQFSALKKLEIGLFARGILRPWCAGSKPWDAKRGDAVAAIPFTSGSTGLPKGVALSSTNILTNIEQMGAMTPLTPGRKLFNAMPLFHSSGLVGGMLMPVLKGKPSMQCASPLMKQIPRLIYDFGAETLFATPTFLRLWAGWDKGERNMRTLREVYSGAERLDEETAKMYYDQYGIRIEAGYGTTEASPTVTMNVKTGGKPGSVGRFMPGIKTKFEPVPGLARGGKIFLRGKNIMKGYLLNDDPGHIYPPPGGWHDTGDVGYVDEDGFLFLTGRLKRCAKIGGEMVPLDPIEDAARKASLKEEFEHAAILGSDQTGADKIILITTDPDLTAKTLSQAAKAAGVMELGLPKKDDIVVIGQMMKLGNGKRDYVGLKEWYEKRAKGVDETAPAPAPGLPPQPPSLP